MSTSLLAFSMRGDGIKPSPARGILASRFAEESITTLCSRGFQKLVMIYWWDNVPL
jgi:hypothetical protein